jgi:hypothetical protein
MGRLSLELGSQVAVEVTRPLFGITVPLCEFRIARKIAKESNQGRA